MVRKLLEPTAIGQLQLRNRLVTAPHSLLFGGPTGDVTARQTAYLVQLARNGAALVSVESTAVDSTYGKWTVAAQRLDDDKYIPMYRELADAVHRAGAKITIQLNADLLSAAPSTLNGRQPVSASAMRSVTDPSLMARALTLEEIGGLVESYAEAARRAREAGFDAVNILAAEGYGPNQFLSPHYNQRTDAYGGSFVNRMRFPLEIVAAIRSKLGTDFPLIWELACDDFLEDGLTLADAQAHARILEEAGIDAFRIGRGHREAYQTIVPPWTYPPGVFVPLAAGIKQIVDHASVWCEGRITEPELAEEILERAEADLIGVVRAFMADPEWLHKAEQGRSREIRKCIGCCACINCLWEKRPGECAINPALGHEGEEEFAATPASVKKRVVVVGGGPGGLEAARTAAARGHDVTLYERSPVLGGLLSVAAVISTEHHDYLRWLAQDVTRSGVKVKTGQEMTAALLASLKPDVVVLAVGAEVLPLSVEGVNSPNVLSSSLLQSYDHGESRRKDDNGRSARATLWSLGARMGQRLPRGIVRRFLGMELITGRKIVVLGEELAGYEMAHFFREAGREVTLVKIPETLVEGAMLPLNLFLRYNILPDFARAGIATITDVSNLTISRKGVMITAEDGTQRLVEADTVVMTSGARASGGLIDHIDHIKHLTKEVYIVGDCASPSGISNAISEGSRTGRLV